MSGTDSFILENALSCTGSGVAWTLTKGTQLEFFLKVSLDLPNLLCPSPYKQQSPVNSK